MEKDSSSGPSWMTKEMNNKLRRRDKIVFDEDIASLFKLKEIALHEILMKRYDRNPNSLNPVQLNLLLCMHIENAAQADSILSFLQEWFPNQKERVVESLKEIGASKSSEITKEVIGVLPKDGSCFFDSSNPNSEELLAKLDKEFSDYPDGSMRDLYRRYAEKYRSELEK